MKRLVFLLFLASSAAEAAVVPVVTRPIEMGGGATWLMFNYDETGAAWIEEKDMNGYTAGDWTTYPKFPLDKLRFDPASRQIFFGRTVCAHVVPMAAGTSVMNTGHCVLRSNIQDTGPGGPRLESITLEIR
ncbi:hypothetical protein [Methylocystis parvus]|uniref:Uncharacterized protein n=1 Tax=Methylocystis parvus TaxID=134 RepID=A0A6B8M139_9HYPH|nr:hypothetical protein [Methylocystis parvus]QGM98577.1 hypothetical protein F7D14_14555 [Methylocystis parvus]WBK01081.1 hypothetical protein MMG94_05015 [Methylocystis parvus OBBP]